MFSYENAKLYKKKTKKWHDRKCKLLEGQQVLLFNSRFKIFPIKLKSKWLGPFKLLKIYLQGVVDLLNEKTGNEFKVNGQ